MRVWFGHGFSQSLCNSAHELMGSRQFAPCDGKRFTVQKSQAKVYSRVDANNVLSFIQKETRDMKLNNIQFECINLDLLLLRLTQLNCFPIHWLHGGPPVVQRMDRTYLSCRLWPPRIICS